MRLNYPRPRDRDNDKESAASYPITKASNISHFHILLTSSFYTHLASLVLFLNTVMLLSLKVAQ